VAPQYQRILNTHTPAVVRPLYHQLYESVKTFSPISSQTAIRQRRFSVPKLYRRLTGSSTFTVGLWHEFHKPPYGGGNQFMLALKSSLQQPNLHIRENQFSLLVDSYLLNSIHFDVAMFQRISRLRRLNVVHRIDGPIFLIRGFDKEKDDLCYELNARYAAFTVLQSHWTHRKIVEMGYKPVKPIVIHNAVNPMIFHPHGRIPFDLGRKIRLISTSWSGNARKGGAIYKWIEQHLDWDRFEYTFVGNASESFEKIHHIPPVASEELANLLRQHDIYITASQNDPCSNALIEALSCGLPALYLNDGGHPELVQQGGLPFETEEEILPQLERLVKHYAMYQRLITAPCMEEVAQKYLILLREASW
jgi:glycosyltransferase involved in cell wall biosynthesis